MPHTYLPLHRRALAGDSYNKLVKDQPLVIAPESEASVSASGLSGEPSISSGEVVSRTSALLPLVTYRGHDLPGRFRDLSPFPNKSAVGIIACMLLKSRRQGLRQDTFSPFVQLNDEELGIIQDFSRISRDDKRSVYQQFRQHFGINPTPDFLCALTAPDQNPA